MPLVLKKKKSKKKNLVPLCIKVGFVKFVMFIVKFFFVADDLARLDLSCSLSPVFFEQATPSCRRLLIAGIVESRDILM